MSKILIISAVFPPEPVVSAILSKDIAEELAKSNDVVVVCPHPTRPQNFIFTHNYRPQNFQVIYTNSYTCPSSNIIGRFLESYSFGKHSSRYIKSNSEQIDIIYINTWPLLSQFFTVRAAKKIKKPCVTHIQDIYPESLLDKIQFGKTFIYKLLLHIDKYILANSNSIIAISDNMKQKLAETRNIQFQKISIVSNWQDERDYINYRKVTTNSPKLSLDPFTFMFLGNNGPLAGVEYLINSFVKAEIPNSRLIIAGSGSMTSICKDLSRSLNAINIEFLTVPNGKVPFIQNIADVMLLPLKKNGAMSSIPSKLPAYMFSAKTIIGSLDEESDTAKAIKEANCGIVIEPENEAQMINTMREVSTWSKKKLYTKGMAGFEYAMKHYSREKNLNKVIKIIKDLL